MAKSPRKNKHTRKRRPTTTTTAAGRKRAAKLGPTTGYDNKPRGEYNDPALRRYKMTTYTADELISIARGGGQMSDSAKYEYHRRTGKTFDSVHEKKKPTKGKGK